MIYWRLLATGELPVVAERGPLSWLAPAERERVSRMGVARRRDDYLLGRVAAKAVVLDALGARFGARCAPSLIEITPLPGGAPAVRIAGASSLAGELSPSDLLPISVSISHSGGAALAAATWTGSVDTPIALGIDLEEIAPRSRAFCGDFLTDAERRYCGFDPVEHDVRSNFVWSAKEAVLKALSLGLTVDTRRIECLPRREGEIREAGTALSLPMWPRDPAWRPFAAHCAPGLAAPGTSIEGCWRTFPGFVATLAVLTGPRTEVQPSAMERQRGASTASAGMFRSTANPTRIATSA